MNRPYLALSTDAVLRNLEKPFVYKLSTDELYEVGPQAYRFLSKLDGKKTARELKSDAKFVGYCVKEGIIEKLDKPSTRRVSEAKSPRPSLRYLEMLITRRCTRHCKHCYLGKPQAVDLAPKKVLSAMRQFENMGGLRVLISGGEPLSHPRFGEINDALPGFALRKVLLTNGDMLTKALAAKLNVHEVQVSIDGLERGHDALRGRGSFKKALAGLRHAREAGLDVSVASMIHDLNLDELPRLRELLIKENVREWGIDVPCEIKSGLPSRKGGCTDFLWNSVQPPMRGWQSRIPELFGLAFGGSYHGGANGWACGRHLATVSPEGKVLKCAFYDNEPLGSIEEGLLTAWQRKKHIRLSATQCRGCKWAPQCGGGCRFRAGHEKAKDIVMCHVFGA